MSACALSLSPPTRETQLSPATALQCTVRPLFLRMLLISTLVRPLCSSLKVSEHHLTISSSFVPPVVCVCFTRLPFGRDTGPGSTRCISWGSFIIESFFTLDVSEVFLALSVSSFLFHYHEYEERLIKVSSALSWQLAAAERERSSQSETS